MLSVNPANLFRSQRELLISRMSPPHDEHNEDCKEAVIINPPTKQRSLLDRLMMKNKKNIKYHLEDWKIDKASDQELQKWGTDPNCIQMDKCAKSLAGRIAKRASDELKRQTARASTRKYLEENPFDPRTEVSADGIYIASRLVKHLWILFVLLPVIASLLFALLMAIK